MKYFVLAVVLIIPIPIGCGDVFTFPVFQHFSACPNNPGLSIGAEGSFDGGSVRDNVVWSGRGRLWTLYTGAQFGVPPYNPTIGIAWSKDGCTWAKGEQVIVPDPAVPECAGGVFSPGMYYDAQADVLTVAVSCISDPAKWYTGPIRIAELQAKANADWASSASYQWQNGGRPVLANSQSWEGEQGVYAPSIAASGSNYYLYYSSSSVGTYQTGIAVSKSPAGPWVKSDQNPITPSDTNCEEPAPIYSSSGNVYLLCDTVGIDREGANIFSLTGTDPMQRREWSARGVFDFPDRTSWSAGEIGSQSLVELSDGRVLLTYNGKPAGTQSDVRAIGFAYLAFQNH
ncbi:MAG TPA: family 43 glycosylhydrolase [Terracidiphilus sp.]|jgi:hypothetical protein|nr:family 43 glycosylhydrolase [Terracidiphilus sp.]